MTETDERPVDAAAVQRAYLEGLDVTTDARAEELREPLLRHVHDLHSQVCALAPYMDPPRRTQADHCLKQAAGTLEGSPPANREIDRTYDLAVSARALLALYRTFHPRDDRPGSDGGMNPAKTDTMIVAAATTTALAWAKPARCPRCSERRKRCGSDTNLLCRDCFAQVAAKWGPHVRQKGYNA
ncbi:hypothetical protein [Streptomyces shenzhenensis]|uniref:hypothetical protein n=1 Tax=Streptomyces shenzhenensis TaxID=943815 RepID=UPI0036BCA2DB